MSQNSREPIHVFKLGTASTSEVVRGRTAASVARRFFGRNVSVRAQHSENFRPSTIVYNVCEWVPKADSYNVLGQIVEYR